MSSIFSITKQKAGKTMVKMSLEHSRAQAESMREVSASYIAGYEESIAALRNFIADDQLQGEAFKSAKEFAEKVLIPFIQATILLTEADTNAVCALTDKYIEEVADESLDSEALEQLINYYQQKAKSLDELVAEAMSSQSVEKSNLEKALQQSAQDRKKAQELQELLNRLLAYNEKSAHLFDDIYELERIYEQGWSQVDECYATFDGMYSLPSDRSWAVYVSAYLQTKDLDVTPEEKAFLNNIMYEYGFDLETAQQLLTVRHGIDNKFPDCSQKDRDYIFLLLVGASYYHNSDNFAQDLLWKVTAGDLTKYFGSKEYTKILEELGLNENEAKGLKYKLRLQLFMASGELESAKTLQNGNDEQKRNYKEYRQTYYEVYAGKENVEDFDTFWDRHRKAYSNNGIGNADFVHQSITMATHLNPNPSPLAFLRGGQENVKDLAGWKGDTTTEADEAPNMKNDDYKSDLDAVNIVKRMEKGQSYLAASKQYYQELRGGQTNRADEFLDNVGSLEEVAAKVYIGNFGITLQDLKGLLKGEFNKFDTANRFILALEHRANSLTELDEDSK